MHGNGSPSPTITHTRYAAQKRRRLSTTITTMTTTTSTTASPPCYVDTLTEIPTPEAFYETYVKTRRPVVLKKCCHKITPKLTKLFGSSSSPSSLSSSFSSSLSSSLFENLVAIVGHDTVIQVNECIIPSNDDNNNTTISFSPRHSRIVDMKFGEFLEKLTSKSCESTYYYMTTQNLAENEEGQPCLYTSPISELLTSGYMDSLRPALLGNLVPMTYNLWLGSSSSSSGSSSSTSSSSSLPSSSSTSGLHHDYHDNLYCLLQGTKQFRVAPPSSVYALKTKGTLHTLHRNGRIVYQEQVVESDGSMIRPDGALEKVERIMEVERKKQEIEARIEALNNGNDDRNEEQRKLLEQQLDAVDEELLDLEMGNHSNKSGQSKDEHKDNDGDSDDDDDDDADDDGGAAAAGFGANYTSDASSSDDDDDDCCEPAPKRCKKLKGNEKGANDTNDDDNDDDHDDHDDNDDGVPLNFVLEESDKVQFQTLTIQKGDLLYLPAGWFHEVFSQGGNSENDDDDDNDKNNGNLHVAFNYWAHPPDVDEDHPATGEATSTTTRSTLSFDKPYKSQFWQRDWDSRGAETKMSPS
jgi:Cupin-like domain